MLAGPHYLFKERRLLLSELAKSARRIKDERPNRFQGHDLFIKALRLIKLQLCRLKGARLFDRQVDIVPQLLEA